MCMYVYTQIYIYIYIYMYIHMHHIIMCVYVYSKTVISTTYMSKWNIHFNNLHLKQTNKQLHVPNAR